MHTDAHRHLHIYVYAYIFFPFCDQLDESSRNEKFVYYNIDIDEISDVVPSAVAIRQLPNAEKS